MRKFVELTLDQTWQTHLPYYLRVAGPCSAESAEQVLQSAQAIAQIDSDSYFRASLWKARTRPDTFEGVGPQGMPWLMQARRLTGLKVMTEVGSCAHVETCLKAELDALWIGARTTTNPYSIAELASALQGVDLPIFIKNPVSPDLGLWIGALERFFLAGHRKLIAVHRGFTLLENTPWRNTPLWEIPLQLKKYFPALPLIYDPSHMAGRSDLVEKLVIQANKLNYYNGLMVEVHPNPEKALSDSSQQLTFKQYSALFSKLPITPRQARI